MKLTLYCFPGACSRATMISLEETGAAYSTHVPNMMKNEQKSPEYLAVNPKGKVPVLVVDGEPLTENIAILGFLADSFPDSGLLPPITDAFRRAQAFSAVAWLSSSLLPAYGRVFRPANICDVEGTEERIKALATQEILAGLTLADKHLDGRDWGVGKWSIADAYLYYIACTANRINADIKRSEEHTSELQSLMRISYTATCFKQK